MEFLTEWVLCVLLAGWGWIYLWRSVRRSLKRIEALERLLLKTESMLKISQQERDSLERLLLESHRREECKREEGGV